MAAEALLLDDWFDAIGDGVRARARGFIETMLEEELSEALSRPRYECRWPGEDRRPPSVVGVRHGHRERTLTGTLARRGSPLRARLTGEDGKTREYGGAVRCAPTSAAQAADALIAGRPSLRDNTRRVRRVERGACRAGSARTWSAASGARRRATLGRLECAFARRRRPIVRLILDGTVARVRLDKRSDLDLVARGARRARRLTRRCCSRSRAWAGRQGRPGVRCALISSGADCERRAGRHRRRARPPKGGGGAVARHGCPTLHRAQASAISSPTRPSACTRKLSNDYRDMIYPPRRAARSRPGARRSSANGASNAAPSPTAWRKPATGCSHSRGSRRANGNRSALRTRSSEC